jgi:hypothetical protein
VPDADAGCPNTDSVMSDSDATRAHAGAMKSNAATCGARYACRVGVERGERQCPADKDCQYTNHRFTFMLELRSHSLWRFDGFQLFGERSELVVDEGAE